LADTRPREAKPRGPKGGKGPKRRGGTDTQIRLLLKQPLKARATSSRAQMMLTAVEAEGDEDLEGMVNDLAAIIDAVIQAEEGADDDKP
jgi:hypothetical protein